jgi:acyl-coenzyme A synthetase/AMP-(fatty) acid ligase
LKSFYQTVDDLHWLQPVPGCLVEIAREDGSLCRPHEEGLVRVLLSDIDATGYLDDPEATARFFRDGFFYPGDIGIKREDGAVRILGRVADVLNVRGDKLAVGPLEQQVQDLLHVETLCLFSGLSREGVDELVVVIESDRTLSREDMQKVAARFPQFERVRFENVQKFPRTEAGMQKIKRGDLRKLVFAG